MQKIYELWLDESGEFENERELKAKSFKPSLVGGLLIEAQKVGEIDFEQLIDDNKRHAMELGDRDKSEYVLPILEKMQKEYGAREVFFENLEYEDAISNRQLYLRIMSEGLLQLMLTLNARYESVVLHVLIAQRQDPSMPHGAGRIPETDYHNALKKCIEQKKKEHKVYLAAESMLDFDIQTARRDEKLQLADFACNTRLTRDSKAFEAVKSRVLALYDNAFLFALTEVNSENYIKRSLVQEHFADAIMELYTTWDELNHESMLELIVSRMQETNYRLVKSEMKQCTSRLIAYAAMQDDYEQGEKFLNILHKELVPVLKKNGQPYSSFLFTLLLQLSDMYLREGDLVAAEKSVAECRRTQQELGNSLEEVFSYYQLVEKEALLAIDSFAFEKGRRIMESACESFRRIMKTIDEDPGLQNRFIHIKSEYYGDALCMQIYAMMFLQRWNPDIYEELVCLSDEAMKQYPNTEGELERHRQYRSHIEMEQGNYEVALLWLIQAKLYSVQSVTDDTIRNLLDAVTDTEGEISCYYYLMYYMLIMVAAKRTQHPLAERMYRILVQQGRMLQMAELVETESMSLYSNEVDLEEVTEEETGIYYHPREILFWKYAGYLYACGKYREAYRYYVLAERICFKHNDYQTMHITGLGIAAEKICCLLKIGNRDAANREYKELEHKLCRLLKHNLNADTKMFIEEIEDLLKKAGQEKGDLSADLLWEISEKITY